MLVILLHKNPLYAQNIQGTESANKFDLNLKKSMPEDYHEAGQQSGYENRLE